MVTGIGIGNCMAVSQVSVTTLISVDVYTCMAGDVLNGYVNHNKDPRVLPHGCASPILRL